MFALLVAGVSFAQAPSQKEIARLNDVVAQAIQSKSTDPCKAIPKANPEFFEACVTSLAIETRVAENCDALGAGLPQSRCLSALAQRVGDITLCNRNHDPVTREKGCISPWQRVLKWKEKFRNTLLTGWQRSISDPGFPPIHQKECEAMGGEWSGRDFPVLGFCTFKTTDAGKTCQDSSECESAFCEWKKSGQRKTVGHCTPKYPTRPDCKTDISEGWVFGYGCR